MKAKEIERYLAHLGQELTDLGITSLFGPGEEKPLGQRVEQRYLRLNG